MAAQGLNSEPIEFTGNISAGILRMGSSSDAAILQFGVFDKAEPSRRAPQERARWEPSL